MKSLLLSLLLSVTIFVFFMSMFDAKINAQFRSLPNWFFIIATIIIFLGYVLALYWGIKGIIREQRLFNLGGIFFSVFGISIYVLAFVTSNGKGKESAGQFDHEFSKIEKYQRIAIDDLLQQTDTKESDAKMVAYWNMNNNVDEFVLCVQRGNVIALQVKNKPVKDVAVVSKLSNLSWLALENCNLKSIANLNLPNLEHLSVDNNLLASLDGLQNSRQISWLNFRDNPITDSTALNTLTSKYIYINK